MEYAQVELICKKCGETFTYKKLCHNRLEAEIAEDRARRRRKPICSICYKAEQQANEVAKAAEMGLPELVGRSEKQIEYAFSLRSKHIHAHEGAIQKARLYLNAIDYNRVGEIARNNGFTGTEECIATAFRQKGLYKEYLCLTECNAQTLIDILSAKRQP